MQLNHDIDSGCEGIDDSNHTTSVHYHVDLEKPAKLAHHLPENAAPHIKKWLKDKGLFN